MKEAKQAEFLMHERFPLDLVERIGVASLGVRTRAAQAVANARYDPTIEIRTEWYF